jgi:hypothetical protein
VSGFSRTDRVRLKTQFVWTALVVLATAVCAVMAALVLALPGADGRQFCPLSDPGHTLLGHFGAVMVFGSVGAVAARRLLK